MFKHVLKKEKHFFASQGEDHACAHQGDHPLMCDHARDHQRKGEKSLGSLGHGVTKGRDGHCDHFATPSRP